MEQSIEFLKRYTDEIDRGFQEYMDEIAYEAKHQENIKTAKKILNLGIDIETIIKATNLSKEIIDKLKK